MASIIDDAELTIGHRSGSTGIHVVSFAGVGGAMGGLQKAEFAKSSASRAPCSVSHVIDRARSWYNATAAAIVDALDPLSAKAARVVTLGSSMGGFGAIYHAARLRRCARAIAFVPQFSVHPDHMPPIERRWADHRARIGPHRIGHALEWAREAIEYHVFFGEDDAPDMGHAARFLERRTPLFHLYLLCARHDLPAVLKERGCLPALLDLLISSDRCRPGAVIDLLAAGGLRARRG